MPEDLTHSFIEISLSKNTWNQVAFHNIDFDDLIDELGNDLEIIKGTENIYIPGQNNFNTLSSNNWSPLKSYYVKVKNDRILRYYYRNTENNSWGNHKNSPKSIWTYMGDGRL